jgi:PAS domain S-box-containing protein
MEIGEPSAYHFSLYAVPMWLAAAATLILGVYVVARERITRETLAFLALHASVAIWAAMTGWMYIAASEELATTWARLAYVGVPLIAPAMYTFVVLVLGTAAPRALIGAVWAIGAGFVALSLSTDLLIAGVQSHFWGFYFRYGPLGIPFLVFHFAASLLALRVLWQSYRQLEPGIARSRVRLFLACYGIGLIAAIDFLPVFGVSIYPIGFAVVLTILFVKARALSVYRLIDLTPAFAAEQILATMADPLLVVDPGGRIRVINAAAEERFGYRASELVGAPLRKLSGSGEGQAEELEGLLELPEERQRELVVHTRTGDPLEISAAVSRISDREGYLRGTILILRDIGEQKKAERLLRNSEERFRSLIQSISDVILVVAADGKITFGSSSLERVVGYRPEESTDKVLFDLVHPDDAAESRRLFEELVGRPGQSWTGEQRVRHRDGSWLNVEASATNLLHHPAVAGVVVSYHDITERKEAEAALRESQQRLLESQKMEAVGRLAGGIAHDFNNLLTIILGQARLALDQPSREEEVRAALEEISRAGARVSELTRQLLAFSRKQMLQPRELDVGEVITDLERVLRRLVDEDVQLVMTSEPGIPRIWADPVQVQQVIVNLAMNSLDAMPGGGVLTIDAREVDIRQDSPLARKGTHPGAYVQLMVSDTGDGIAPDILPMIYEPFFSTKEVGKGTGLGLSTVYGFVEQSGGAIQVDSAVGRGTTFRLYFPVLASEGGETTLHAEAAARRGETILLVEDSEPVRVLAGRMLRRRGYTVIEAENGFEALRIFSDAPAKVDLVVTDVVMPGMAGPELVDRLRASEPKLPALLISGHTDDASYGARVADEGMPFLQKPFTPDELVRKVRDVLDVRPLPVISDSS